MKILMLHDVRPFDPSFFPARYEQHSFLTDSAFRNGLARVGNEIIIDINWNEVFLHPREGVLLTFDDGLTDHLKVAEQLSVMGIKAVFFIPFGVVYEGNFIDSHLIQFVLAGADNKEIARWLEAILLNNGFSPEVINRFYVSRWGKKNIWKPEQTFVTRVLREVEPKALRKEILDAAVERFLRIDLKKLHSNLYLTPKEVARIKDFGHIIGSHGWKSVDLSYAVSGDIKAELVRSREALADFLHGDEAWFSYPNGGVNESIVAAVASSGYSHAFTTEHRSWVKGDSNFLIPRLDGTKLGYFYD